MNTTTTTTPATVKHVGYYTFAIKSDPKSTGWLWIVLYRGEHLASGHADMWTQAEYKARTAIATDAKER